ncbi:MAG: chromosome partitioning protein ParB [Muribaculaceae bacterium]|nr:chromosome partitioning protein ParB [Muribaculaceae bacterium]
MGKKIIQRNIFGEMEEINKKRNREDIISDYDGFVDKFKDKKTTDDCYTPPHVYEAIKEWVNEKLMRLDNVEIVRPFYPGGDYVHANYPKGCLVLDNPPFSILAQIRRFYHEMGIKYFLFAPALTLANSAKELESTFILAHCDITYENGAVVKTSFVTNIECGGIKAWVAGDLNRKVKEVQSSLKTSVEKPIYKYPIHVISPALMGKVAERGVVLKFHKDSVSNITTLDSQRKDNKVLFGGGWLLSERAAAERAAAERAVEKKQIEWTLSDREWEIIKKLK